MGIVVAPILKGKLDAWKQWGKELNGPRRADIEDFNRRHGLTRHRAWLAETPSGPVVVALHEGPGADEFMGKLASSQNETDLWFIEKVKEFHGLDVTQPPPGPLPELYLDSRV